MRQSRLLPTTLRESPGDAEIVSHRYLLRAGFIRQLAAGIYTYMPLGRRVLRKLEQIVREEMDRAGAQELLLPAMQPAELWKESGRYEVYGTELIRLVDRHGREFALGPTHEEVVTALVRNEISSYRKLPVTLYQIQTKFRDERRPRYGLLRGREFLMKDAYSFDSDPEGLDRSYRSMFDAYHRIFERCGLSFSAVEADAGAIGGQGETHEFIALADIGEDTIAACTHCDYAANLERAEAGAPSAAAGGKEGEAASAPFEKLHTPGIRTIEQLVRSLRIRAADTIKTVIFIADGQAVAVAVRGDDEINEIKVKRYLGTENVAIADPETVERVTGAPAGYAGPIGLTVPVLVDRSVVQMTDAVTGANEADYRYIHVRPERDIDLRHAGDFRNATEGDNCPRCSEGKLAFYRGIELGHVFKLGTKYSERMGATFLDQAGQTRATVMGCYGIGISRMMSAVIEQNHDENGMIWPLAVAPFQVHLIPVSVHDEQQMRLANDCYERLRDHGIELLLDDRAERPGVKFKDADLIGIPFRIVVGKEAANGHVEFMERKGMKKESIPANEAISRIVGACRAAW